MPMEAEQQEAAARPPTLISTGPTKGARHSDPHPMKRKRTRQCISTGTRFRLL